MPGAITRLSLKYRFVALGLSVALMVVGVVQLRAAPVDVLPEISPPYVEIQTEALGLSANEVEQLVTLGLEQDLLNGVPWLQSIYSDSMPGLSSIVLVFEPGTDLVRARQMVAERLAQAFALPHVSKPPTMLQPVSSTSRVMVVGLSSQTLSPIQLGVLARWTISPRLLGVPGVANVAIWGLRDRQLQVLVDPQRLRDRKISLAQVLETTGNALWVSSLSFVEASTPGTGGFVDTANQRLGIRHMLPIVSPEGLAQVPIGNTQVVLGDVATIAEGHQPLIGDAVQADSTGMLLVIEKFPGANPLQVTLGVESALAELAPGLAGLRVDPTVYRPADFIELSVHNLGMAGLLGGLLLIILLAAYSLDWRRTLVSLVAITLTLVVAGLALQLIGATMNVVLLTGLLMAEAGVVAQVVLDVDGIARPFAARSAGEESESAFTLVLDAAGLQQDAMVLTTLALLLISVPIFFFTDAMGSFLRPLGLAYAVAVLASTVVALSVTPALCLILMRTPASGATRRSPVAGALQRACETVAVTLFRRGLPALVVGLVLAVASVALLSTFRESLIPAFEERDLAIQLETIPGTSLEETRRVSVRMSSELESLPGVVSVTDQVGRAIFGDEIVNVNSAELWVKLHPAADYAAELEAIREIAGGYPGVRATVGTYLNDETGAALSPPKQPLTVRVYGDTDAGLRASAEGIQREIMGLPGVAAASIAYPTYEPTLEVEVDLPTARHFGVSPGDVRRAAAAMVSGIQVGSLFEEQKVFDVVVWSTPSSRHSIADVENLDVDTPKGSTVRIGQVARVRLAPSPAVIRHEAVHRYFDIAVTTEGRSEAAVADDIRLRLQRVQLPLEYHAEVLDRGAAERAVSTRVMVASLAALLAIFLLLQAAYRSWRLAAWSIITLPISLAGGAFAIFADGRSVSLGSFAGLLAVSAFAIATALRLTAGLRLPKTLGGSRGATDLIARHWAPQAPALLAAGAAAALFFVPAWMLGNVPGLETMRPMGPVVLGGIASSLLVNLYLLPVFCAHLGLGREPDLDLAPSPQGPQQEKQANSTRTAKPAGSRRRSPRQRPGAGHQ